MTDSDANRSKPRRGPLRTVLYVPAIKERAMEKLSGLTPDAVIYDLEDAVAPDDKDAAREALRTHFRLRPDAPFRRIIRINPLAGPHGTEDLLAAVACLPDAVLLPKVDDPKPVLQLAEAYRTMTNALRMRIWAMIETPRAMMNLPAIAELGRDPDSRLDTLVLGTNDLAAMMDLPAPSARRSMRPLLLQAVCAAKAGGMSVLDGVCNDLSDTDALRAEASDGRAMGFDGKTLIHPKQIDTVREAYTPDAAEQEEAQAIVAAFAAPENAGRAVLTVGGRMVEHLHRDAALRLLERAGTTPQKTDGQKERSS